MTVQFLHIGKTGGNAVRHALAPLIAEGKVVWHRHRVGLADIEPGEPVAFFVRDPVTRFVSGFNSRLRKGQPNQFTEWRPGEPEAFGRFPTPNALAEALAQRDPAATTAMGAIAHVNRPMTAVLGGAAALEARRADIAFVGFQEMLAADFERMKAVLDFPVQLALPDDPVTAHRTPPGFETGLSATGRAAIAAWYADDIALVEQLRGWR